MRELANWLFDRRNSAAHAVLISLLLTAITVAVGVSGAGAIGPE